MKKEEIIQEVEPPAPDPTPEPTPEPTPVLTPVPIPVPTPTQVEKEEYKKQLDSPAPAPELPFYENIKNLHSLVSEDIPLQSVYNLINVSEMTESLILLGSFLPSFPSSPLPPPLTPFFLFHFS